MGILEQSATPVSLLVINRQRSFPPPQDRTQKQMNDNLLQKTIITKPKVFRAADYEHVRLLIYTWHRGKKTQPSAHLEKT